MEVNSKKLLTSNITTSLNNYPGLGREPGGAPTGQPDRHGDGNGEARAGGEVPEAEERVQSPVEEQQQRPGRAAVQGGAGRAHKTPGGQPLPVPGGERRVHDHRLQGRGGAAR